MNETTMSTEVIRLNATLLALCCVWEYLSSSKKFKSLLNLEPLKPKRFAVLIFDITRHDNVGSVSGTRDPVTRPVLSHSYCVHTTQFIDSHILWLLCFCVNVRVQKFEQTSLVLPMTLHCVFCFNKSVPHTVSVVVTANAIHTHSRISTVDSESLTANTISKTLGNFFFLSHKTQLLHAPMCCMTLFRHY